MQDLLNRLGVNINVTFSLIFFTLIWVRILAMAAVLPFLFGKPVPRTIMVGASAALAVFAYPNLVPLQPPELPPDLLFLTVLYLKEAFIGFVLGFAVGIIFHAFQAVGQMIDNQRGMSIARVLVPALGEQAALSGLFLFQFAVVIYLSFGGHRVFFEGFMNSYKVLPVLEFPSTGPGLFALMDLLTKFTGQIFYIAMQLAAPVIIAILLVDIIMGIANRIAPQINVWEMSFNAKGYVGILLLFASITMIGKQIYRYSDVANRNIGLAVSYMEGREVIPEGEAPPPEEGVPKPEAGPPQVITE
jgi:flagellar biosynthetic protein FliR